MYKITVAFGRDAQEQEFVFNTCEEVEAFKRGLDAMDGWSTYEILGGDKHE